MLSIEKIHQRSQSRYQSMLKQWDVAASLFPMQIPLGKITGEHKDVYRWNEQLTQNDAQHRQGGYKIISKEVHSRTYGKNHFPTHVEFSSPSHLAGFLGKQDEWNRVDACYAKVADKHPSILADLLNSPSQCLAASLLGEPFFNSIEWMLAHPIPRCYLREIPALPHSKYVEDNSGVFRFFLERLLPAESKILHEVTFERRFGYLKVEHFFTVKLLDHTLLESLNFPFMQLALHPDDLVNITSASISKVIIVENQVNLLTLPDMDSTIAIHGNGYALARLKSISWMQRVPIFYWGDIDVFGYEILSELRKSYPQTQGLMMEPQHIRKLTFISSESKISNRKNFDFMQHLTRPEKIARRWCQIYNKRIEQERIPLELSINVINENLG